MSNPRLTQQGQSRSPWTGDRRRVGAILAPVGKFLSPRPALHLPARRLDRPADPLLLAARLARLRRDRPQGAALDGRPHWPSAQRVQTAELLDYDHQVVVTTDTGIQLYADYPAPTPPPRTSSARFTKRRRTVVQFNPQSRQVRAGDRRPVPASRSCSSSASSPSSCARPATAPAGSAPSRPSAAKAKDARRARKRRSPSTRSPAPAKPLAELQRDPRLPRRPVQIPGDGGGGAEGRAAGRSSRYRQDAARPRHRRRGRRRLLQRLRRRVRRVAGRGRRGPYPRPLRQSPQVGAGDHLHRRARCRRPQARRRRRPGQRRARADAEPAAGRDGRLRRRRRRLRDGRDQPSRHPRPGAAAAGPLRPPGRRRRPRRPRPLRNPRAALQRPLLRERRRPQRDRQTLPGLLAAPSSPTWSTRRRCSRVREGFAEIDQPTLEEAIDRVVAGPAKKTHILSEDERWRIAIHESGHAVATRSIGQMVSAQKLSIVARGRQLGTSANMLTDRDAVMHAQSDLERHLVAIIAGTAAEWGEFGEGSTGCRRRPPRRDQTGAADGHQLRHEPGARLGHDRRGRRRGLSRRQPAGPRLGRPAHAGRDRRRDRASRRGGQGASAARPARQLGQRAGDRPRRCWSTRRSPASPSMRSSPRSSTSRSPSIPLPEREVHRDSDA